MHDLQQSRKLVAWFDLNNLSRSDRVNSYGFIRSAESFATSNYEQLVNRIKRSVRFCVNVCPVLTKKAIFAIELFKCFFFSFNFNVQGHFSSLGTSHVFLIYCHSRRYGQSKISCSPTENPHFKSAMNQTQ